MRRHGPDEVRAFGGVAHRECEGADVGGVGVGGGFE